MDRFFKFLFENPILLVLVIGWILSLVGGVLRKAAANAQRQQQRREPGAPTRHAQRRSPEEIAAEMRRILGVDEPPAPPRHSTPPPPAAAPAPRPVARPLFAAPARRAEVEARPIPVEVVVGDRVRTEVQSHVGEALQRRAAPISGGVGRRPVSQLAGRVEHEHLRRIASASGRLVDLHDLRRAIVLREILDPPLAMRDEPRR